VRRFSAAALAFGVFVAAGGALRAAEPPPYTLGTTIDVVLTKPVSSETAQLGDLFYFTTKADVNLGTVTLPAGTPGTGRLATVVHATHNAPGQLALQADSLTGTTTTVWVNIDTSLPPRGKYSTKKDILLDPGMAFRVITISPRSKVAPLMDETPAPPPAAPSSAAPLPSSAAPLPSPAASAQGMTPSVSPSATP
jgi:hypothetical protein